MLQKISSVFVVYRRKTLTGSPAPTHANGTDKPCMCVCVCARARVCVCVCDLWIHFNPFVLAAHGHRQNITADGTRSVSRPTIQTQSEIACLKNSVKYKNCNVTGGLMCCSKITGCWRFQVLPKHPVHLNSPLLPLYCEVRIKEVWCTAPR